VVAEAKQVLGAKIAAGETEGLRGAIGTPDQLRSFLERYEQAGVDQVIFVLQAGNNRHEHIMESIDIFGTEILPEFKERDPQARSKKAKRLGPHIEAAMARKVRSAPPLPENYSMPALPKMLLQEHGGEELLDKIAEGSATGQFDAFRDLAN
ncbi:MAG: hypothetical protein QF637_12385, partial [Acidimicrobiales bacterium]|nr:hypothetical protein [Acidimicrobiales bacterium]